MLSYHNDHKIKEEIIKKLERHYKLDEIVQGVYWENGKGCAVGCTIESNNHAEYEARFGIPEELARLEDKIFEGLAPKDAREWPIRFMKAIPVGVDLSLVHYKFMHWLLTDEEVNPGINHDWVRDAVTHVADLMSLLAAGEEIESGRMVVAASAADSAALRSAAAGSTAESAAAWSAAAWSAARSAAWSAARSAEYAARSAAWSASASALNSAAARSAEYAVRSVARSSAAWSAACVAWRKMADKLIKLLKGGDDAKLSQ